MRETKPYWLAAGVALWGAIWVWQGLKLPQFDQYAGIGPGLMVTVIGFVLIILGIILASQINEGVKFEEQQAEDTSGDGTVSYRALALATAGCAIPMLTMEYLGFPITATLAFWLVARAFKSPNALYDLLIGLVLSFVAFWLFGKLGVQLGPLLPILGK